MFYSAVFKLPPKAGDLVLFHLLILLVDITTALGGTENVIWNSNLCRQGKRFSTSFGSKQDQKK